MREGALGRNGELKERRKKTKAGVRLLVQEEDQREEVKRERELVKVDEEDGRTAK